MSDTPVQTLDYRAAKISKRDQRNPFFWRAARYLAPYKKIVVVSVLAAFFAGGVFAGGLGAVLPVLQTLLNGDTPQMWADRMVAEKRWGIDIKDDPSAVVAEFGPGSIVATEDPKVFSANLTELWRSTPNDVLKLLAAGDAARVNPLFDKVAWLQTSGAVTGAQALFTKWAQVEKPVPLHLRLLRRVMYALPSNPVWAVAWLMGGILLLSLLANVVRFFQESLSGRAAVLAVNDLRRDAYDHVLRVPMSYFGKVGTGDVTSRIVGDAAQLQQGFATLLGPAVQQPVMGLAAFAVALWLDWRLTLFVIAFAPVMGVLLQKFGKKMRRMSKKSLANNAELLGQIEATLGGIRVVKANVAERHESGRLKAILDRLLRYQLKLVKYDALSAPVMETMGVLAIGVIATVMVYFVRTQGSLSAANGVLIFGCLAQMADSFRRVSKLNILLQKANAAAERIFETVDLPSESVGWASAHLRPDGADHATADGGLKPTLRESIAFDNVTFRYADDQPAVVKDVSLTVSQGESVAVVGRNGSGKTTLLSLLPRFFEPEAGSIRIDDTDIRDVPLDDLRKQISVVTQEAVVFPGTIAENIAYADPTASRDDIIAAAEQAYAHDFIEQKPGGYDFPLTGLGGQLSGGQRQRLNIARAILRDAPILILDEATSQVDAESEHLIQQALVRLMRGRTTFVIAHRFSTILDCDRIALMERGRLEAVGTHGELLETSDLYRALYDRQLVGA